MIWMVICSCQSSFALQSKITFAFVAQPVRETLLGKTNEIICLVAREIMTSDQMSIFSAHPDILITVCGWIKGDIFYLEE